VNEGSGADGAEYNGPIIAYRGPRQGAGSTWIWVANGTDSQMFRPPLVRRPPPPEPPEGFSADRIIESYRAEAWGLDQDDPFSQNFLGDEEILGGSFDALELVFPLQPQRDSNPCRHLERVVS
jgi:hypothetical protein